VHGSARARCNSVVQVLKTPAQTLGQKLSDCGFTRAHEAHEKDRAASRTKFATGSHWRK
jgi:hypothetical protein